jgi:N-acylneuraminate cytidylyltransferase
MRVDGAVRSTNFDYRRRPRRQEMLEEFRENGSIFVFRPTILRETGNRLGGHIELFPMHSLTAVETDTDEGFMLSECILPIYRRVRGETV